MPDVPLTADAPGAGRRPSVVFVAPFIPWPRVGGVFQRNFRLLGRISRQYDVHLVAVRHKREVDAGRSVDSARDALQKERASVQNVDHSRRTTRRGLLLGAAASLAQRRALSIRLYDDDALGQTIHDTVAARRADIFHLDTSGLAQHIGRAGSAATVLGHINVESLMTRRRVALQRRHNLPLPDLDRPNVPHSPDNRLTFE